MQVTAKGLLRHYFHGNYSAAVVLFFASGDEAAAARSKLGAGWRVGRKPEALVWTGGSDALTALKAQFRGEGFTLTMTPCTWAHCTDHCASAEIDGLPHSIDHGPPFSLTIECDDPRQLHLL